MAVISFANGKGGSGKTTSALVVACELAERGRDVVLIDADPRHPITDIWAALEGVPEHLEVVRSRGERHIQDEIEAAAVKVPFVIVDLEGTESLLSGYAMAESDMVVVPAQEQYQDAIAAGTALGEVRRAGRAGRRDIPAVVLLTRCRAAVKSRTARSVADQLRSDPDIHVLGAEMIERDAFAALFSIGGTLRTMSPKDVNGLPKAIENAEGVTKEVLRALKQYEGRGRNAA